MFTIVCKEKTGKKNFCSEHNGFVWGLSVTLTVPVPPENTHTRKKEENKDIKDDYWS